MPDQEPPVAPRPKRVVLVDDSPAYAASWRAIFAERYGDRLAFIGGLDAIVLESGDRARIRREIGRILDGIKAVGARCVFGSDHSLSPNVRYADFRYALDVYREQMAYP